MLKLYGQFDTRDCGPACLYMILKYYKVSTSFTEVKSNFSIYKDDVSLFNISQIAIRFGFKAIPLKATVDEIINKSLLPVIPFYM